MPYSRDFGGCALSSTIDVYVHVALGTAAAPGMRVRWREDTVAPSALGGDGPLILARQVLDVAGYRDGLDCEVYCEIAFGSGLGSSSAMIVALLAAVDADRHIVSVPHVLARRAFHVEREVLSHAGGAHDQFASVFGGTNFFDFYGGADVRVTPVRSGVRLAECLVLCDTGLRRKSDRIIQRQMASVADGDARCLQTLHDMKHLTMRMRDALRRGDLAGFADLMSQGWERKRSLVPGISNPVVDELYERGRSAGALGGRIVGAGGGGHMLFVVEPQARSQVAAALTAGGGHVLPFSVERQGVQVSRAPA
jgi:D-glycero-alpha-D-manno-heptose-7-phosphate kinase